MSRHHRQTYAPPKGEVIVDTDDHTVYDTSKNPAREVGRTRTTPTRHDGTQETR